MLSNQSELTITITFIKVIIVIIIFYYYYLMLWVLIAFFFSFSNEGLLLTAEDFGHQWCLNESRISKMNSFIFTVSRSNLRNMFWKEMFSIWTKKICQAIFSQDWAIGGNCSAAKNCFFYFFICLFFFFPSLSLFISFFSFSFNRIKRAFVISLCLLISNLNEFFLFYFIF